MDQVVEKSGLYNAVVGIQLMYDFTKPGGSCSLIELNPRPHDWAITADHSWNIRRGSVDYFDYGFVHMFLHDVYIYIYIYTPEYITTHFGIVLTRGCCRDRR